MFILYKWYSYKGNKSPVAIFSSVERAKKYVENVTLEIMPNTGFRRFRSDSLLGSASNYTIEEMANLPNDPEPPTAPSKSTLEEAMLYLDIFKRYLH